MPWTSVSLLWYIIYIRKSSNHFSSFVSNSIKLKLWVWLIANLCWLANIKIFQAYHSIVQNRFYDCEHRTENASTYWKRGEGQWVRYFEMTASKTSHWIPELVQDCNWLWLIYVIVPHLLGYFFAFLKQATFMIRFDLFWYILRAIPAKTGHDAISSKASLLIRWRAQHVS